MSEVVVSCPAPNIWTQVETSSCSVSLVPSASTATNWLIRSDLNQVEAVADERSGRLMPRPQHLDAGGDKFLFRKLGSFSFNRNQLADQVLSGAASLFIYQVSKVGTHGKQRSLRSFKNGLGGTVHSLKGQEFVGPELHAILIRVGNPHDAAQDAEGQGESEIADHVHLAARLHHVNDIIDNLLDHRPHGVNAGGVEGLYDERP